MPRLPSALCAALLGCTCLMRPAFSADPQTPHAFEHTLTKSVSYKYLLALPDDYAAGGEKRWPLLLFLHGSGERGDDLWAVAKHGPPKLLRTEARDPATQRLAENFIVVSPQCPKGRWWDTEAIAALLDEIMASHKVDPRRVYLTGLSMGGYATWELGLAYPERFAAIVPICGGGTLATLFVSNTTKRQELRTLGVWAFHGAKDETVPLNESQRLVDFLKKAKVDDVQLTIYPEAKHDSWTETYANPELYAWLLRHERTPPVATK